MSQKPEKPVTKPYMKGTLTDRDIIRNALGFLGVFALCVFVGFIVCTMAMFDNLFLRILVNGVLVLLMLFLFYNNGCNKGSETVARSEIMQERIGKGFEVTEGDRRTCYHRWKGFLIGLLGMLPVLICCILLAVTAQKIQMGYGALPNWISNMRRRVEIGSAVAFYSIPDPLTLEGLMRTIVRVIIMPVVAIVGANNKEGLLWLERLSPLVVLLPVVVYGIGYTKGVALRNRVHTAISKNENRRKRKERRERKKRAPREPEQLN